MNTSFNKDSEGLWIIKDPQAALDYMIDWTKWLAEGDTLFESVFTATPGITIDNFTLSTTQTVVWLSGGAPGKTYKITNRVTSTQGRVDERSFRVKVESR